MPEHLSRPKIGLALGGGVARGWAHIGAIRALEKAGFKPDIVCGTSIGALVGGFYLAGRLDELEEWALSLNKRRLISYLDIVTKSSGLFGGKKLERLMLQYINGITIEELDRKFAAVATELATGHEIWIQHGSLAKGIEASYALPGVFPPVRHENRWLIDGALVNPVPVSTCRALGARLVVAVSLNYDAFGKSNIQSTDEFVEFDFETVDDNNSKRKNRPMAAQRVLMRQVFGTGQKSPGIGSVMLGSLNIIMDRLSRSRMAGDPADVLIAPRIGHISLLEFDRAEELIQLGEESVEQILPFIEEAMAILSI